MTVFTSVGKNIFFRQDKTRVLRLLTNLPWSCLEFKIRLAKTALMSCYSPSNYYSSILEGTLVNIGIMYIKRFGSDFVVKSYEIIL